MFAGCLDVREVAGHLLTSKANHKNKPHSTQTITNPHCRIHFVVFDRIVLVMLYMCNKETQHIWKCGGADCSLWFPSGSQTIAAGSGAFGDYVMASQ